MHDLMLPQSSIHGRFVDMVSGQHYANPAMFYRGTRKKWVEWYSGGQYKETTFIRPSHSGIFTTHSEMQLVLVVDGSRVGDYRMELSQQAEALWLSYKLDHYTGMQDLIDLIGYRANRRGQVVWDLYFGPSKMQLRPAPADAECAECHGTGYVQLFTSTRTCSRGCAS